MYVKPSWIYPSFQTKENTAAPGCRPQKLKLLLKPSLPLFCISTRVGGGLVTKQQMCVFSQKKKKNKRQQRFKLEVVATAWHSRARLPNDQKCDDIYLCFQTLFLLALSL